MPLTSLGFCVIYRWHLKPGQAKSFCEGWDRITEALMAELGALGSRIHFADDGTWIAYAQWPDRESWEQSRRLGSIDARAAGLMEEAIVESFEPVLLTPRIDHLKQVESLRGELGCPE